MLPGDLIFWEGQYYDKYDLEWTPKHNIVHVEVYIGPGARTIGAR